MAGELHSIVSYINTSMRSVQLKSKRFQKGRFVGIAEQVKSNENGETKPSIIDNAGESEIVSIDDTYPIVVYHRVLSVPTDHEESKDFGDNSKNIKQTFNMLMVVYGDRNQLKLTKEDLITGVAAGFPLEITNAMLASSNLVSCELEPGTFNMDRYSIYKSEFNISEDHIKPNTILISFSYQIVLHLDQSCFSLCN